MHSLNGRALFALLAGSFVVASACSGTSRSFPSGGAGDAGDSNNPEGGATNHAGTSNGGAHQAGTSNGGAAATGGDAGSSTGAVGGDVGEGGTPGTPECGAPGTPCCEGNLCIAHAACTAASCKCSANYTACNDECVDLKADPKNCGTCGHDCLGGTCDIGVCQPVNVVTGQSGLEQMTTDGTYLYFTGHTAPSSGYYVARRRVDASDAVKMLAPSEAAGYRLTIGGTKLYWVAAQHLRVCDLPDCASGPKDAIPSLLPTKDVALSYEPSKGSLFLGCSTGYPYQGGSTLLLASGSTTPVAIGPNQAAPYAVVNDASDVYWLNTATYTTQGAQNPDGGIWRYRASDAATTQLVNSVRGDLSYLAIGGGALYFAGNLEQTAGKYTSSIIRAPLPNGLAQGTLPTFAASGGVRGLLADDNAVYFGDSPQSTGTISRCPIAACPTPEVIVPGIEQPELETQDAVSIYWKSTHVMNGGYTTVLVQRLAK